MIKNSNLISIMPILKLSHFLFRNRNLRPSWLNKSNTLKRSSKSFRKSWVNLTMISNKAKSPLKTNFKMKDPVKWPPNKKLRKNLARLCNKCSSPNLRTTKIIWIRFSKWAWWKNNSQRVRDLWLSRFKTWRWNWRIWRCKRSQSRKRIRTRNRTTSSWKGSSTLKFKD
jgi:hypothetical protein